MTQDIKPNWKWTIAGVLVAGLYGLIVLNDQRLPWLFAETSGASSPSLHRRVGIRAPEGMAIEQLPTGGGITVGHVEGQRGDYLPNAQASVFKTVRMTPRSGKSKINGHAEFTSRVIYGPAGMAPGVSDVNFYTSPHWLAGAVLKTGTSDPPDPDGRRVFTHSWISDGGYSATEILRRADYLIDQHDVVMTVGINNGKDTPIPAVLASAYNVIAVGLDTGNSSGGYTRFGVPGRCKPDIVAPRGVTSFSTPVVAAIAARLLEQADSMSSNPDAGRSELIKAVLLAGAEKPKGWKQQPGKPLDEHLGAGLVRFDQSYSILAASQTEAGQGGGSAHGSGWDFQSLPRHVTNSSRLSITEPSELSVVLVWNRRIDGRQTNDLISGKQHWPGTTRLSDFDLRLVRLADPGAGDTVAVSASDIDNVEHIYRADLAGGEYRLEVSRKDTLSEDWEYALAWRVSPKKMSPPAAQRPITPAADPHGGSDGEGTAESGTDLAG